MKLFNCFIALMLFSLASMTQAGVAVIVNPGAPSAPNQAEVANIFLGKDKSLTGVDQEGWNPVKENFYTTVTSKNESQLKSYWSGLIFTGKGQPPASVAGDAAVVARVASDASAIGYIDSAAVTDAVKVLFTLLDGSFFDMEKPTFSRLFRFWRWASI